MRTKWETCFLHLFALSPVKKYSTNQVDVKNFSLACFYYSSIFFSCYSVMSLLCYRDCCIELNILKVTWAGFNTYLATQEDWTRNLRVFSSFSSSMWKTSAKMAAMFLLILLFSRVSQISCSYFSKITTPNNDYFTPQDCIISRREQHCIYIDMTDQMGLREPGEVNGNPAWGRGFGMRWSKVPFQPNHSMIFMLAWIIPPSPPTCFPRTTSTYHFPEVLQLCLPFCLSPTNSISPISDFSKCVL